MSEKILFMNRGDLFTLKFTPLLANKSEKGVLETYSLRETDVLYFAIMPPTGTFEDALVLQAYTHADADSDNSFTIMVNRRDTYLLRAGIYYYTVKLATGVRDPQAAAFDENIDMTTILGRAKLIVSDGSMKATANKFITGKVPTEDEVPDTPDAPEEPEATPDVLFETYAEAELYARNAPDGKFVSVLDETDPENILVYVVLDGVLSLIASSKNPGGGSGSGGGSTGPVITVGPWVYRSSEELTPEDFEYNAITGVVCRTNPKEALAVSALENNTFTTSGVGYVYFITDNPDLFFTCGGFSAGMIVQRGTVTNSGLVLYKSNQIQNVDNLKITIS